MLTVSLATGNAALGNDIRYTSSDRKVELMQVDLSPIKVTVKGAGVTISNNLQLLQSSRWCEESLFLKYTLNNNDVSDITVTSESICCNFSGTASGTADKLKDLHGCSLHQWYSRRLLLLPSFYCR
ncbi:MAG: hypothetical protein U0518_01515 [Candidatus Gracilibacteria bacterium]